MSGKSEPHPAVDLALPSAETALTATDLHVAVFRAAAVADASALQWPLTCLSLRINEASDP